MAKSKKNKETLEEPVTSGMKSHAYDFNKQLDFYGGDPTMKYGWVSKLDQKLKMPSTAGVNHRIGLGYEVVRDPSGKMGGPRMSEKSERIETHDMILMQAPKELQREIQKSSEDRSKNRITGVIQEHKRKGFETAKTGKPIISITKGAEPNRDNYEKSLPSDIDIDSVFEE